MFRITLANGNLRLGRAPSCDTGQVHITTRCAKESFPQAKTQLIFLASWYAPFPLRVPLLHVFLCVIASFVIFMRLF
ncbi:hypothetical protein BDV32DRAFT_120646 [Aspergillus pseudonomiae]|nr:hypothetical protein BDV32DRAFT_120646 [Aspergillus pseudonomiae]